MVPSEGAIHDLLTLAGTAVDPRKQGVGRVSPEEPCIGPKGEHDDLWGVQAAAA
jgi:hypothetical protein